jgi:hypothetical protein
VTLAETWIHANQYSEGIGNPPDTDAPRWLNEEVWLGPAPYRPHNRNRTLYNFHWSWDYSGGIVTEWGT